MGSHSSINLSIDHPAPHYLHDPGSGKNTVKSTECSRKHTSGKEQLDDLLPMFGQILYHMMAFKHHIKIVTVIPKHIKLYWEILDTQT